MNLPKISDESEAIITRITTSLNVPREILPSDEEIIDLWDRLPKYLRKIPVPKRGKNLVKMCVAVGSGLFDSGLNYVWNDTVIELQKRIKRFGYSNVAKITGKPIDEKYLNEMMDKELIDLCLKLNTISEEGAFYLDNCREIRNNYSVAHPNTGAIDEAEFASFLSRCVKYALSEEEDLVGVDLNELLVALKSSNLSNETISEWKSRIRGTFSAQKELIIPMLHGIYCDGNETEICRNNTLKILKSIKSEINENISSLLINKHSSYIAKNQNDKMKASREMFESLELISILSESEKHTIISTACSQLMSVHHAMNNFYNEPPFARRLKEVSEQTGIPETARQEFVETVLSCAIGNRYGVCNSAEQYYTEMINNFTPKQILEMFKSARNKQSLPGSRLKSFSSCRSKFYEILTALKTDGWKPAVIKEYNEIIKNGP